MAKQTTTKKSADKDMVTIICYRQEETMPRKKAIRKYFTGMMCCEGSERERYTNIYQQLVMGYKVCNDEIEY